MEDVRIWKVGESDWIAAATVEDAKKCLAEMIGEEECEELAKEECYQVPEADLDKLTVSQDEDDIEGSKITFRAALNEMKRDGTTFPTHFCTNEF